MYSIAYVGPKSESLGLRALGIETRECNNPLAALNHIKNLVKSGKIAIIFVDSIIAEKMSEEIEKLKTGIIAIIPIAGSIGSFEQVTEIVSGLSKEAIGKEIKIKS